MRFLEIIVIAQEVPYSTSRKTFYTTPHHPTISLFRTPKIMKQLFFNGSAYKLKQNSSRFYIAYMFGYNRQTVVIGSISSNR